MPFLLTNLILCTLLGASEPIATDSTVSAPRSSSIQWHGARGMSQTLSAEPLGQGRIVVSTMVGTSPTSYPAYKGTGKRRYLISPPLESYVSTFLGAAAIGLTPEIDLSGWAAGFTVSNWPSNPNSSGFGSSGLAVQYAPELPWPLPVLFAGQASLIAGTSAHPINSGIDSARGDLYADGFEYFETRMGWDLGWRFIQSAYFQPRGIPVEVHANEGWIFTTESSRDVLAVMDLGVAVTPFPILTLGIEGHLRTRQPLPSPSTDPRWITLSSAVHLPTNQELSLGVDISESNTRTKNRRKHALQPWRLYFQFAMPIDRLAHLQSERKAEQARMEREVQAMQKQQLEMNQRALLVVRSRARIDSTAQQLLEEAARKAVEDSITAANTAHRDSIVLKNAVQATESSQQRRIDSLRQRIIQDSLRVLEADRIRAEKRIRGGNFDAELRTHGILILEGVFFPDRSAEISSVSYPYLDLVARRLQKYPTIQIEIGGHLDKSPGSLDLTERRAAAVRRYLANTSAVLKSRLSSKGYGDSQPLASNATPEGRAQNRRIELLVLNPDELSKLPR